VRQVAVADRLVLTKTDLEAPDPASKRLRARLNG
jgi:G3E family GTPase